MLNDLSKDGDGDSYYSRSSVDKRKGNFFLGGSTPRNNGQPRPNLVHPIVIPLEASPTRGSWGRTYSPSLMDCGIEQQGFLRFLDSFNKSLEVCFRFCPTSKVRF